MATTVERRTVTKTVSTEGAQQIKSNLTNIAEEISRVRDRARDEVTSLERIKGMLDVGYLNDLIRSVEELEVRMETLEKDAISAAGAADATRKDLEREQDRLSKLWAAYKAQEDELERLRRDSPLLQERLVDRERTIESLRKELQRLEPLARYKNEYDAVLKENQSLRVEVEHLGRELRSAHEDLDALNNEAVRLREDASSKTRVRELEGELEGERERLAKLYKVYEDREAELRDSSARLDRWESWFQRIEPSMTTLCRAASDAPRA
jgi:chromosome segregation ATPase